MGFASCKAFGRSISASIPNPQTPFPGKGAILLGLPPLDQARMLAVSHTKPLHDAVAQMADDLYGGFAPATPFLSTIEVFRQSEASGQNRMLQLYILSYKLINQTVYIFPLHFLKYTVTHSVKYFKSDIKAVFDKKTGFFFCISAFIAHHILCSAH